MLSRGSFNTVLLFLFALLIHGVNARPSYSLASKRSPSVSSLGASLEYKTNAKRMAAGLSPRSPTRVFDASRVVPRAVQSPVPYSGNILVKKASNNADLGYISKSLHSSGRLTLTSSSVNRASVSLSYVDSSTLLELKSTISTVYPNIGASGATLATNNNNRNNLVLTSSVSAGSTPSNVGNSSGSGGSESYIWKYNPSTTEITAVWVNPNGSTVTAHLYYEDTGPNTGLHISANSNLPGGFERVRLFLG